MLKKITTQLINIFVVVAVLAVLFYSYKIIANKSTDAIGSGKTALVTVEFNKYDRSFLEKIKAGDVVMDGTKHEVIGTIKSVSEIENSVIAAKDYENERYVDAQYDSYGKITVILECGAVVTPSDIKLNNTNLKIGTEFTMRTASYTIKGPVLGIEIVE